jgi:chromosome segregation ATPase
LIALSGIHRTARDLAHAEELTATKNQTYWMGELKRAMEAVSELERRNVSLWKRRGELETESPKLEIELGLKDELVHNITKKQVDNKIVMAELTEPIHRQKLNFTEWDSRLEFIDSEIARVNQSLSEILAAKPESAFNMTEYNTARGEFNNISSYLNATYFNLSVAEESAVNTTKRIEELVVEFKQTERTYFEKERILKEYTDKVDQGLIPKVEFKFEY